jgi:hypothetical protein
MSFIVDTPYTTAYVRNEFLFDEQEGHGEFTLCTVFGFRAEPGRVPMFQVMLESGAQWARVPVHMICSKPCDPLPLELSCWWDSFSRHCAVIEFNFLRNHAVKGLGRDGTLRKGNYLFTIDWSHGGWSEIPDQHKNHHIIALQTGQWIAYPNNKLLWTDPSWTDSSKPLPKWKSPSRTYSAEFKE